MGRDDDIARALPRPPHPAPARREAALAEALRRFDGADARPGAAPEPRRQAGPSPWWTRLNRPQSGALAGALLVALIAVPLAWTSLPDQARQGSDGSAGTATTPGTVMADAEPSPPASDEALPRSTVDTERAAPDAAAAVPESPRAVAARIDPPAAPAVRGSETLAGTSEEADRADGGGGEIVVTGSRIRRPNLESSVPITTVGGEEFSARGAASRRGDWNACTVEDPRRELSACRRDVGSVSRGASGKAGAHLGDGLSRAWERDWEAAIAAFDRAVALAPRSSAAYLNRGLAWRSRGDLDRALADLDRAILYAPQAARGYYHRSLVLRERGDLRRARSDEARAVELDPAYERVVRARR
jgi:hypothetical protein